MQAVIEDINTVQKRLKVKVPKEKVSKAFQEVFSKLQRKANISGFRPGKAPLTMVKRLYKDSATSEVWDKLIKENLFKAFDETKVHYIGTPYIEGEVLPLDSEDFEFSAVVDILPEIKLNDAHKKLSVTHHKKELTEEFIERGLVSLTRQHAKLLDLPEGTSAQEGHLVKIRQTISLNGSILSAPNGEEKQFILGKKEAPVEIEKVLIGMLPGVQKDVKVSLPLKKGNVEETQEFDFNLELLSVHGVDLPNLDDEFAKDLNFESFVALKNYFRENWEKRINDKNRSGLEETLLQKLRTEVSFDVPPTIIESFVDHMIDSSQLSAEEKKQKKADQKLRKELRTDAKSQAKDFLILKEIVGLEKLEVSDKEIQEDIQRLFQVPAEFLEDPTRVEAVENLKLRAKERLLIEKAFDVMVKSAQITEIQSAVSEHDEYDDHDHGEEEHVHDENCSHGHGEEEHVHGGHSHHGHDHHDHSNCGHDHH